MLGFVDSGTLDEDDSKVKHLVKMALFELRTSILLDILLMQCLGDLAWIYLENSARNDGRGLEGRIAMWG